MKLELLETREETPTIFSIILKKEKLDFKPGQYLNLFLPLQDPKGNTRQFSIASSPTESNIIIATRQTNSIFKQTMAGLKPGSLIDARGPYGSFLLDENHPAIMLSGGIGITPLRCMIKYSTDKKFKIPITLFYSNRTPEEIAFKRDFATWIKQNKNLKVINTITNLQDSNEKWNGLTGYIDEKMIKENAKISKDTLFYICGPPAMVDAMADLLKKIKIDDSKVRVEHFTGY